MEQFLQLIEPAVLAGTGLSAGLIVLASLLPMYSLLENLSEQDETRENW